MIISRTPVRVSFAGGGSDLPSFHHDQWGAVISTAINKYIYITVNKKFDDRIRVSYSKTEFADRPEDIKHELVRESLKLMGLDGGIEITSISDIPSKGTGLGSSSTYTVGLLNALSAFKGKQLSAESLARDACEVEIGRCGKPIGKQDQYAAAFGGLNFIRFKGDSVFVDPVVCKQETKRRLEENLLLLYTGITRLSSKILKGKPREENLRWLAVIAKQMKLALEDNDLGSFGDLLDRAWRLKRKAWRGVSSRKIDGWYKKAKGHGAVSGKVLGAGGGGFLLLYAPKARHRGIINALPELRPIPFAFEPEGSKIIYYV